PWPVIDRQESGIGEKPDKCMQRIKAHLARCRRPDRCAHRKQMVLDEGGAVAAGLQIVAEADTSEIGALKKPRRFLVETQDIRDHRPEARSQEIGFLACKSLETRTGIFEGSTIERGGKGHFGGERRHLEMLE